MNSELKTKIEDFYAFRHFTSQSSFPLKKHRLYSMMPMLDMPTAFRMFMVRSKMVGGLPFDARLSVKKPVAAGSLTKEELDSEIQKGFDDMLAGKEHPAEEVFSGLRKKYEL